MTDRSNWPLERMTIQEWEDCRHYYLQDRIMKDPTEDKYERDLFYGVLLLAAIGAVAMFFIFLLASGCSNVPPIPPFPTAIPTWVETFLPQPTATPPPPTATPTLGPPTPTATVTPIPPTPKPTSTPGGIPDVSQITFLDDGDVGSWGVTSTVTGTSHNPGQICIYHTAAGRWPVCGTNENPADGNPWIIGKVNGKWMAWTYEWLGRGQTCKGVDVGAIGTYCNAVGCPRSWHPTSGELVGLFVSTCARAGLPHGKPLQRSTISWVKW